MMDANAAGDSSQDAVVAFLEDPATHGGAAPKRIDTHAAMVFLAGDDVYKIKRAVRYPYLDFSTLDRRKAACRRELEVNRAYAGEIYHGLIPITRDGDGALSIDGDGEPVEWAVHMRRFDEGATLDHVITEGPLPPETLDALGDRLVEAHADAPRRDGARWIADLESYLDDNAASFAAAPDLFPPEAARRLNREAWGQLALLRPLLRRRDAEGRIRLLHGDCHLGNIAMIDGAPRFFDAIEFDDRIATGDVLYDLAFLVMDLWRRGHRADASRVFNRYVTVHGDRSDFSALAAFPFFLMMRAAIRAKVTAARLRFLEGDAREAAAADARDAFAHACAFLEPDAARAVAVGGLSGTGKTTLARRLAPDIGRAPGAVHLRSDVIRKRRAGVGLTERLPKGAYTKEASAAVYDDLLDQGRIALGSGQSVVLDAVFAAPEERGAAERMAREAGVGFAGIWLEAAPATLEDRVTTRTGDASDADADVIRTQAEYDLGTIGWQHIDAGGGPDEACGAALAALEAGDGDRDG
ncbi:bifunctional aminoglycoside phosphotransferase/ATP-binding protein [Amorphus orientalis]|uniref:Aminoglycoside phosphotransferase family enzyme/predicted kinase n=1 Tax=Amorphus orientalis TaxID=649198 RepID=A0AAE3VT47_9HYPH|nr:bifunctional aminoglycoside phosphotransferase/ATP-binding protein [Amorphus orientalis]MDQ0317641.1 aminoglycoside phosphotransferase family enzyme/predicted kinase [Amorphus orientalis]